MNNRLKKSLPRLIKYLFYIWLGTIGLFIAWVVIQINRLRAYYKPYSDLMLIVIAVGVGSFCLMTVFIALQKRVNFDKKENSTQTNVKKIKTSSTNRSDIYFIIVLSGLLFAFVALLNQRALDFENAKVKNYETINKASLPSPTTTPVINNTARPTQKAQPTLRPLPVLNGGNIFGLINTFRTSNGKPFLSVSDELCRLAEARVDYMMANNRAAFKSSETGGHTGLIDVANQYSGGLVGENLAMNHATDASVVEKWKISPPHRELMLWTVIDDVPIVKGCIATRVSVEGSMTVLLVGDK